MHNARLASWHVVQTGFRQVEGSCTIPKELVFSSNHHQGGKEIQAIVYCEAMKLHVLPERLVAMNLFQLARRWALSPCRFGSAIPALLTKQLMLPPKKTTASLMAVST